MITSKLEELILNGQATFKTFVAGGATDKHVLEIEQDRFIVITDITYFSHLFVLPSIFNLQDLKSKIFENGFNTQLSILGNKGFNRYVFRNNFNLAQVRDDEGQLVNVNIPMGHVKMDCYLLHTEAVSFNFSSSLVFNGANIGIANTKVPAYPVPMDYGKDGQLNSINTIQTMQYNGGGVNWLINNQFNNLPATNAQNIQTEFSYPIFADTSLTSFQALKEQYAGPILHVNYVEIKGLPNNINSK